MHELAPVSTEGASEEKGRAQDGRRRGTAVRPALLLTSFWCHGG